MWGESVDESKSQVLYLKKNKSKEYRNVSGRRKRTPLSDAPTIGDDCSLRGQTKGGGKG